MNRIPTIKELELADLKSNPMKYIDTLVVYKDSKIVKDLREGLIQQPRDIDWDKIDDYLHTYTQKHTLPIRNFHLFMMNQEAILPKVPLNSTNIRISNINPTSVTVEFTVNH